MPNNFLNSYKKGLLGITAQKRSPSLHSRNAGMSVMAALNKFQHSAFYYYASVLQWKLLTKILDKDSKFSGDHNPGQNI